MKNKFYLFALSAAALMSASCANDVDLTSGTNGDGAEGTQQPIGFQVMKKNQTTTRADKFQDVGHYNFGVFGYKSTDATHNIMENYLVGYCDGGVKGYEKPANATTWGDQNGANNGESYWVYEGFGSDEYSGKYAGEALAAAYKSNVANQYLRYWDYSAPYTNFYAYAPYVNGANTITYDNGSQKMKFPKNSIVAGYDRTDNEFLFGAVEVAKDSYNKDVAINFKHMTSNISLKFYEDIAGYSVKILDWSTDKKGVYFVPAVRTENTSTTPATFTYTKGTYVKTSGAEVNFAGSQVTGGNPKPIATTPTVNYTDAVTTQATLNFAAPEANEIGTTKNEATASATNYYAVPKAEFTETDGSMTYKCGFTLRVTYQLTSTTGETITVHDAAVFVPADCCNWKPNYKYTYIFKITKGTNGSTGTPGTNPDDPKVDPTPALYPIVFDNVTVDEWTNEGENDEHEIYPRP